MKLILQAIKALFRKVENFVEQTATVLSKRIDKAQSAADKAKTNASKANVNANNAQKAAESAQQAAESAQASADGKMSAVNPDGTGNFSMNRAKGSIVGKNSSAFGSNAAACGENSAASGLGVVAGRSNQCAIGKYNIAEYDFAENISEGTSMSTGLYTGNEYMIASSYEFNPVSGIFSLVSPFKAKLSTSNYKNYYIFKDGTSSGTYMYRLAEGYSSTNNKTARRAYAYTVKASTSTPKLFVAGNGESDNKRSNAHTLDWDGVPWYQGRPQFGGTEQDNGAQTVMANGDTEIILRSATEGSAKQFKITVDDSGTITATEVT